MTTDPGDPLLNTTCLRKGTRVWARQDPPPNLPVNGEERLFPQLAGSRREPSSPHTIPPLAGGVEGGQLAGEAERVMLSAGLEGGQVADAHTLTLLPVESLQPGDWVLAHDRQPHRVHAVISKLNKGKMIGIFLERSKFSLWVTEDHYVLCDLVEEGYPFIENQMKDIPPENYARARQMRMNQTPAERRLWSALRGRRGRLKFRRQHNIGPYIVDFYCRAARLVIEVDGGQHQEPENQDYDWARDSYLNSKGLKVLRF